MVNNQLIIIKSVGTIPKTGAPKRVDSITNINKVLKKFGCNILVNRTLQRELERNRKHRQTKRGHPRCPIRLIESAASRQRTRAVEHSNVIQSKKAAAKYMAPFDILTVHPPREV